MPAVLVGAAPPGSPRQRVNLDHGIGQRQRQLTAILDDHEPERQGQRAALAASLRPVLATLRRAHRPDACSPAGGRGERAPADPAAAGGQLN